MKELTGCEWPSLTELNMHNSDMGNEGVRMMLNLRAANIELIYVGNGFDYLGDSVCYDEI